MTEKNTAPLAWHVDVRASSDGTHRFCQVRLDTGAGEIGDPDVWSVVGLVQAAIDDMLERTARQALLPVVAQAPAEDLFADLAAWHRGEVRLAFAVAGTDSRPYSALPEATELFDGEEAYLVRLEGGAARLLWRDYVSEDARAIVVDFEDWRAGWLRVREEIGRDGGQRTVRRDSV